MKGILVSNIKGGAGKSTLSAGLAASFFGATTPTGEQIRAVWVWADRYAKNTLPERILAHHFGEKGARRVSWLADRGFYVCLREQLAMLTKTLEAQGKLDSTIFLFDSGAQLVGDAATYFAPASDIVLVPINRSSAADGLSKALDTIHDVAKPDGATTDPAVLARTYAVLNQMPLDPMERERLLRKQDFIDILSAPIIRDRLMAEALPASRALQDVASIGQSIHAGILKRARMVTAPLLREVVSKAGWDLTFPEDMTDAMSIKDLLIKEAVHAAELAELINAKNRAKLA